MPNRATCKKTKDVNFLSNIARTKKKKHNFAVLIYLKTAFFMKQKFYLFTLLLLGGSISAIPAHGENAVKEFPLEEVRLLDGPFKHACDLDIQVLLQYDTDRLLAPFFKEAGLPLKAELFPNWAGLDGHVAGHYLSALAMAYASTGNTVCKERADYIVNELKICQDKNGNGYLGGVPNGMEIWNEIKSGNGRAAGKRWSPWYNLHKMYAGLRDAYLYTGNETARQMFLKFCDWGIDITTPLDDNQMEAMLDTEYGGMNEVYVDAYEMTGDKKYLDAARRFTHHRVFDSASKRVDHLDNMHANTQVPKFVGFQRVAEVTDDSTYFTAADFFWETVAQNRSLSFGGNSRREHFPSADHCIEYAEDREGPESCNTYNMLKLAEGLFRMNPQAKYADFYERALFNHILSTQHPEHGGFVYFTPARPRHYRVYSAPNQGMWCCVGTGMENHVKYGKFIYSHTDKDLYVNLFIASELDWEKRKMTVKQETEFPNEESTRLTFSLKKPSKFALHLRYPSWVAEGELSVKINGKDYPVNAQPSSYFAIERKWKDGDVVEMQMPMHVSIENIPNVDDYASVLYGPIVLAARSGTEDLRGLVAGDSRWGHIASGRLLPLSDAPAMIGTTEEVLAKLENMQPVAGKPLHFTCTGLFLPEKYNGLVLEPFSGIHDSRYTLYFHRLTASEYQHEQAELARQEQEKLETDRRTVDRVKPGEQQPETDHQMLSASTSQGYHQDESWRDAADGGFFSYKLATGSEKTLTLRVRYWGEENGTRKFDILADGQKIGTEDFTQNPKTRTFVEKEYAIPATLLEGKSTVEIRFQPQKGCQTARIFHVALLKQK